MINNVIKCLCILILVSCSEKQKDLTNYSFFIAGHAYGSPYTKELGVYPKFKSRFNELKNLQFGVFTGDVVKHCKAENWDAFFSDISFLKYPIHLAPGNHDSYQREVYDSYWEHRYHSFNYGNDLHIILDGNDGWNIKGKQLKFLESSLDGLTEINNIFIYVHQVIWLDTEAVPKKVIPNSPQGRDSILNFRTDVLPLLERVKKPIYLFAGDVGAGEWASNFTYFTHKNIHLISSGMGDSERDHYLKTSVKDGEVIIEIIPLGSQIDTNLNHYKKPYY